MWQVISNVYSGITGACTPGDTSVMGSLSFVSAYGEYFYPYSSGPYPLDGDAYSGGIFTTPMKAQGLYRNWDSVLSHFCFDVELPLGCAGLLGIDIEIQASAYCATKGYQGSTCYFKITDVMECPVDVNTELQEGPDFGSGYLILGNTVPRRTLLGYQPATFIPSGSSIKRVEIVFTNDYRGLDVTYTLHDVFWRNV